jgi:hypothetical protein
MLSFGFLRGRKKRILIGQIKDGFHYDYGDFSGNLEALFLLEEKIVQMAEEHKPLSEEERKAYDYRPSQMLFGAFRYLDTVGMIKQCLAEERMAMEK